MGRPRKVRWCEYPDCGERLFGNRSRWCPTHSDRTVRRRLDKERALPPIIRGKSYKILHTNHQHYRVYDIDIDDLHSLGRVDNVITLEK